jgi:DNA-binding NarL/FixJ family response regulator
VSTVKKKIRILIADQEGVFRLGLKKLFAVEDDLYVVAQADQPAQIPGLAEKFKPDVIFVQLEMMGRDAAEFITRVRYNWAGGKIIVVVPPANLEGKQLVRAGAVGIISRATDPEEFIKSARHAMRNELWLPKSLVEHATEPAEPSDKPRRPVDMLTRREKSIIACLIQGWRNREIAQELHITEQTVKNHLRAIFDKVGVSDRLELALYAIHQKLDLPPVSQSGSDLPAAAA